MSGVIYIILYYNFRSHRHTLRFLHLFGWIVFKYPPYSLDLDQSGYYLLPLLKTWLGKQRFTSDVDLKTKVNTWFHKLDLSFYARDIALLVSYYDECMNCWWWLSRKIKNFRRKIPVFVFVVSVIRTRKKIVALLKRLSNVHPKIKKKVYTFNSVNLH